MLVSSLTRSTLSSDQRNAARLREPVRKRSPGCSFSSIWAIDHVAVPLRAISTLPSFSTSTQCEAGASAARAGSVANSKIAASTLKASGAKTLNLDAKWVLVATAQAKGIIKEIVPINSQPYLKDTNLGPTFFVIRQGKKCKGNVMSGSG